MNKKVVVILSFQHFRVEMWEGAPKWRGNSPSQILSSSIWRLRHGELAKAQCSGWSKKKRIISEHALWVANTRLFYHSSLTRGIFSWHSMFLSIPAWWACIVAHVCDRKTRLWFLSWLQPDFFFSSLLSFPFLINHSKSCSDRLL